MKGEECDTGSSSRRRRNVFSDERAVTRLARKLDKEAALSGWEEDQIVRTTYQERKIGRVTNADAFSRWAEKHRYIADCINNEIILRELPRQPHAYAQARLVAQFLGQPEVDACTAVDMIGRISGDLYTPDVVVSVDGPSHNFGAVQPGNTDYAVTVIEIATSQTPRDLHERAAIYLSPEYPGCEFYVGLKRYDPRQTDGLQGMVASVYDRVHGNNPLDLVSFGTGPLAPTANWNGSPLLRGLGVQGGLPCNMAGIPEYVLTFPADRVFASRVGGVPVGAPPNYLLDLFPIQQAFSKHFTSL